MVVALGLVAMVLVIVAYVYAQGSGYGRMGLGYERWCSLTSERQEKFPLETRKILTPDHFGESAHFKSYKFFWLFPQILSTSDWNLQLGRVPKKTFTANIVAIGIIERQRIGHNTFGQWVKPGSIVSILTLGIATLLIYLQFCA